MQLILGVTDKYIYRPSDYSGIRIAFPLINKEKKNGVKIGPPLAKLSGSAHDPHCFKIP